MIGQTLAIFVDAYRDLNARKLFWITLILSAVVVAAFSLLGFDSTGLKLATAHVNMPQASFWYKVTFRRVVIGLWLTWAATVLALISTAGIFPELISGGTIDLYLAKPIGRARLFITKYLTGLFFVTLQVAVIAIGSFLDLGLRGHEWNARLFWAIPIVVCFFSYLFGFCVLLGVKTRSTIAALLLTIVFWTLIGGVDWAEPLLLGARNVYEANARSQRDRSDEASQTLVHAQHDPKQSAIVGALQEDSDVARREADSTERTAWWLRTSYGVLYSIKTITPKTTDTVGLLDRIIFANERDPTDPAGRQRIGQPDPSDDSANAMKQTVEDLKSRSVGWIVGTSLAFELVLVGAAMWIFCRRDY